MVQCSTGVIMFKSSYVPLEKKSNEEDSFRINNFAKKTHFYSAEKQKTNQKQSNHFNFFSLDFFVPNFFHKKHSKKKKASPIFFLLFSDSVEDGGTAF